MSFFIFFPPQYVWVNKEYNNFKSWQQSKGSVGGKIQIFYNLKVNFTGVENYKRNTLLKKVKNN